MSYAILKNTKEIEVRHKFTAEIYLECAESALIAAKELRKLSKKLSEDNEPFCWAQELASMIENK